jgi:hypothetical protein
MNKVEKYLQKSFNEDVNWVNNLTELATKTRQLVKQAEGYVRDCFLLNAQDYSLRRIVGKGEQK